MNKILTILLLVCISKICLAQTVGERSFPNDKRSQERVNEMGWQSSSRNHEQYLQIRSKHIESDIDYEVTFIVTDLLIDKEYTKKIIVVGNDWGMVTFPNDFETEDEPIYILQSEFKWVGQVDGVTKVWGSFSNVLFDK